MKRSLRSWLWRVPVADEVDEELEFHLEMRTRELVARGMDPADARRLARERLGNLADVKRTCLDEAEGEIARCTSRNGSTSSATT